MTVFRDNNSGCHNAAFLYFDATGRNLDKIPEFNYEKFFSSKLGSMGVDV